MAVVIVRPSTVIGTYLPGFVFWAVEEENRGPINISEGSQSTNLQRENTANRTAEAQHVHRLKRLTLRPQPELGTGSRTNVLLLSFFTGISAAISRFTATDYSRQGYDLLVLQNRYAPLGSRFHPLSRAAACSNARVAPLFFIFVVFLLYTPPYINSSQPKERIPTRSDKLSKRSRATPQESRYA
eukprot:IDg7362t1